MSVWSMTVKYSQNPLGKNTSNSDYGHWFQGQVPAGHIDTSRHGNSLSKLGIMAPNGHQGNVPSVSATTAGPRVTSGADSTRLAPANQQNGRIYSFKSRVNTNGNMFSPRDGEAGRLGDNGSRTTVIISKRPADTPRNSPDSDSRNPLDVTPQLLRPIPRDLSNGSYGTSISSQHVPRPISKDHFGGVFSNNMANINQKPFSSSRDNTYGTHISTSYVTADKGEHAPGSGVGPRGYAAVGLRPGGLHRANTITEMDSSPRKVERRDIQDLSLRRSKSFHETGSLGKSWKIPTEQNIGEFVRNKPQYSSLGKSSSRFILPSVPSSNSAQDRQPIGGATHDPAGHGRVRTPNHWMNASRSGSAEVRMDNHTLSQDSTKASKTNGVPDPSYLYSSPNSIGKPTDLAWGSIHPTTPNSGPDSGGNYHNPYNTNNYTTKTFTAALSPNSHGNSFQIKVTNPHITHEPKLIPTFPSRSENPELERLGLEKAATFPMRSVKGVKSILKKTSSYAGQNRYETISQPLTWTGSMAQESRYHSNGGLPSVGGEYRFQLNQEPIDTRKANTGKKVTFAM